MVRSAFQNLLDHWILAGIMLVSDYLPGIELWKLDGRFFLHEEVELPLGTSHLQLFSCYGVVDNLRSFCNEFFACSTWSIQEEQVKWRQKRGRERRQRGNGIGQRKTGKIVMYDKMWLIRTGRCWRDCVDSIGRCDSGENSTNTVAKYVLLVFNEGWNWSMYITTTKIHVRSQFWIFSQGC